MRDTEQIVTWTQRTEREIRADINRQATLLRLCWVASNGQSAAVQGRLDKLWEECRAAMCQARQHGIKRGRVTNWEERNGEKADA